MSEKQTWKSILTHKPFLGQKRGQREWNQPATNEYRKKFCEMMETEVWGPRLCDCRPCVLMRPSITWLYQYGMTATPSKANTHAWSCCCPFPCDLPEMFTRVGKQKECQHRSMKKDMVLRHSPGVSSKRSLPSRSEPLMGTHANIKALFLLWVHDKPAFGARKQRTVWQNKSPISRMRWLQSHDVFKRFTDLG